MLAGEAIAWSLAIGDAPSVDATARPGESNSDNKIRHAKSRFGMVLAPKAIKYL